MKFTYPSDPGISFDIPDEWIEEAGAVDFAPIERSYRTHWLHDDTDKPVSMEVAIPFIDVAAVMPFDMSRRQHLGPGGLDRARLVSLLRAFVDDTPLPPIGVSRIGRSDFLLRSGVHRFHGSIVVGFHMIPAFLAWQPETPSL